MEVSERSLWEFLKEGKKPLCLLLLPFFLNGTKMGGLERQQLFCDLEDGAHVLGWQIRKAGFPGSLGPLHRTPPKPTTSRSGLCYCGQCSVISSQVQMLISPAEKGLPY